MKSLAGQLHARGQTREGKDDEGKKRECCENDGEDMCARVIACTRPCTNVRISGDRKDSTIKRFLRDESRITEINFGRDEEPILKSDIFRPDKSDGYICPMTRCLAVREICIHRAGRLANTEKYFIASTRETRVKYHLRTIVHYYNFFYSDYSDELLLRDTSTEKQESNGALRTFPLRTRGHPRERALRGNGALRNESTGCDLKSNVRMQMAHTTIVASITLYARRALPGGNTASNRR